MNGVIIGRFMPPHMGHLYLIDVARHMVDRLYVLVCTLSHEPIPGELRYAWVQELAPACRIIHITEEIPEARRGAAGATAIWARTVREAVGEPIDRVFASEDYGWDLARELDAQFVPVDPNRSNIPVSATAVRRDPWATWQYIPPVVRPYFVRHLAVVDAPETAAALAAELQTVVVHSYRTFWEETWQARTASVASASASANPPPEDPRRESTILQGIHATATALARQANRILIYDLPNARSLSEISRIDAIVAPEILHEEVRALVPEGPLVSSPAEAVAALRN